MVSQRNKTQMGECTPVRTAYSFAIGVVESLQLYNVWMAHDAHDLQLTILEGSQQRLDLVGS